MYLMVVLGLCVRLVEAHIAHAHVRLVDQLCVFIRSEFFTSAGE